MEKEAIRAMTGTKLHSRVWTFVLCGVAGIALAAPLAAKDAVKDQAPTFAPGAAVDISATVIAVREVPAGDPLPGIHVDLKVKGRTMDVYLAPVDFARKYGVKVAKGDDVRVIGTQAKVGDAEVVLAREITTGSFDSKNGGFRPDLTVYLRNDDGPFWMDAAVAGPAPVAAH